MIFYRASFDNAQFEGEVSFSDTTRFCGQTSFRNVTFEGGVFCDKTHFDTEVSFAGSRFKRFATFEGVEFRGGASFAKAVFEFPVMFDESKFEEKGFPQWFISPTLADFKGAQFLSSASFRKALFGNNDTVRSRRLWPERRADFTTLSSERQQAFVAQFSQALPPSSTPHFTKIRTLNALTGERPNQKRSSRLRHPGLGTVGTHDEQA